MKTKFFFFAVLAMSVLSASAINPHRVQRIDRETQKYVFIPKGQWMVGGTVSYTEHSEDNLNFTGLKNIPGDG